MRDQVAVGNPSGPIGRRSARRSRFARWGVVAIIAGLSAACGSSSPKPSSQLSPADLSDRACVLVPLSQASTILGHPAAEVPGKSEPANESSCTWHAPASHELSFDVFVNDSTSAVGAFRSNLSHPQPPVLKTTVGDTDALWRPASGPGMASSYVSAVAAASLVSVEAVGSTSAIANRTALAVTKVALGALSSK